MASMTAKIQQGRGLKGSIDLAFFAYFFWQCKKVSGVWGETPVLRNSSIEFLKLRALGKKGAQREHGINAMQLKKRLKGKSNTL